MALYRRNIKPIVDFSFGIICLAILSPIIIIITILLTICNSGLPFFFQERPGKNGELFTLIKFKTMRDEKDNTNDPHLRYNRITRIGGILRKLSLDEIPQLINVIKGDMSIIGPRPLLVDYLPLYNEFEKRRHEVKPGITGWAQVKGRNSISWDQKFKLDIWYVDNLTLKTDLEIFFLTILKLFKSDGIYTESGVIMERFKGSK